LEIKSWNKSNKIESMNIGLYKFAVEDAELNSLVKGISISKRQMGFNK
jgi:hypothetical protein